VWDGDGENLGIGMEIDLEWRMIDRELDIGVRT
jgi:hypothetical protein